MNKTLENLPEFFYDLISIFIPASYLFLILCLIFEKDIYDVIDFINIPKYIVLPVILYFAGHLLYSFSNLFVAKIFNRIFGDPKVLLLTNRPKKWQMFANRMLFIGTPAKTGFFITNIQKGISKITGDSDFDFKKNVDIAYEICRNYVMEKTKERKMFISKELAYGEMARAIIFATILSILLIIFLFFFPPNYVHKISAIIKIIVLIVVGFAFSYRYLQSRVIIPYYVYLTFSIKTGNEYEKKDII